MKTTRAFLLILSVVLAIPAGAFAQAAPIRAGERITIDIKGVPAEDRQEVSGLYTVNDSGTIHLPYLPSDPKAVGLNATQLASVIEKAYRSAQIYTSPTIVITMDTMSDNSRRVTVMGEVKGPRPVPYSPGMTLLEVISACSGFTDFAREKEVRLIRNGQTSLHDVTKFTRDPSKDIVLQPGDKVLVPQVGILGR